MVTEYAPKGRRGFYGSWPQIGFAGGLAISTAIIWIMSSSLSDAAFESWGWRVPFFASGLLVAVGLYIRLKIEETPAFTELQQKQEQREGARRPGRSRSTRRTCCARSACASRRTSPSTC